MKLQQMATAAGLVVLAVVGLTVCSSKVNPDKGTFACKKDADCGTGFECREQALTTTGSCFKKGSCSTEVCDGVDNDCNGIVDDTYDFASDPTNCGACGVTCGSGTECLDGVCNEALCADKQDNDNNGLADCADEGCLGRACDTANPLLNCGHFPGDGGNPDDPDFGPLGCVPPETACSDGLDNDGDNSFDCSDSDCDGKVCDDVGTVCSEGSCG